MPLVSLWIAAAAAASPAPAPSAPPPPAAAPAPGWTRLADLPVGQAKAGAAWLGRQLVLAGGYDTRRTSWLYDPASDRWQSGPVLPRGTDNPVALAAQGRVHLLGGEAATALQLLDAGQPGWTLGPPLPSGRFAAAAAVLDERLYLAGGWNLNNQASASLASVAVFDLARQTWTAVAALPAARNAAAGVALEGRFCVVGGRAPGIRAHDQAPLDRFDCYDPSTDRWTAEAPLPTARGSLAAAVWQGRLYTFGGETAAREVSDAVERYDPATRRWQALPPMPLRAHGLAAVAGPDGLYVLGGFTQPSDAVGHESVQVWRYRPQ